MKSSDVYVHAGFSGATTVVVKNPSNQPVPPATLNEAAVMAISYRFIYMFKRSKTLIFNLTWVVFTYLQICKPKQYTLNSYSLLLKALINLCWSSLLLKFCDYLVKNIFV